MSLQEPQAWREQLLSRLLERDRREKAHTEMIQAYSKLAAGVVEANKPRPRSESGAAEKSTTFTSKDSSDNVDEFKATIADLYKKQSELKQQLNTTTKELDTAKDAVANTERQLSHAQARRDVLERKDRVNEETMREKNKEIQYLQDEILTFQLQLSLLEDKVNGLEADNRQLLERWMQKMKQEAEKMNEANEMYEAVHTAAAGAKPQPF
ncbi:hypothetical protein YB2330_000469 [Saitoella coloradoensis]